MQGIWFADTDATYYSCQLQPAAFTIKLPTVNAIFSVKGITTNMGLRLWQRQSGELSVTANEMLKFIDL